MSINIDDKVYDDDIIRHVILMTKNGNEQKTRSWIDHSRNDRKRRGRNFVVCSDDDELEFSLCPSTYMNPGFRMRENFWSDSKRVYAWRG